MPGIVLCIVHPIGRVTELSSMFSTQFTQKLQMSNKDGANNLDDLHNRIDDMIFHMTTTLFRPYFVHVGFP